MFAVDNPTPLVIFPVKFIMSFILTLLIEMLNVALTFVGADDITETYIAVKFPPVELNKTLNTGLFVALPEPQLTVVFAAPPAPNVIPSSHEKDTLIIEILMVSISALNFVDDVVKFNLLN